MKRIRLVYTTLISMLFLSLCNKIEAQTIIQDPVLVKGQLDNGLTYYIYPNDYPKGEAVYRLFIKSGSVFETDEQKGLAHFLEHMAFNGTEHFPEDGIIRFLESKGAKFGKDLNAHTSFNETVYKLQLPTHSLGLVDSTLTILADWAGGLTLDDQEIDKERGVIMSEWLSKQGPQNDIQNAFLMELLNGSKYSDRIVIGDTAVIQNFPYRAIKEYYRQWYDPSLMAVAVVGDLDSKDVEKMIKSKFGSFGSRLKGVNIPSYGIKSYKEMDAKVLTEKSLDKIELSVIQLTPKIEGIATEQEYEKYLTRVILNKLIQSRFSSLSFDNQPYKKASLGFTDFLNTTGLILGSVQLTPTKVKEGIEAYGIQLEQMYKYGFLPLEIEKAKKSYLSSLKRKAETKKSRTSAILMSEVYSNFYGGNVITTPLIEYELAVKYSPKIDSVSLVSILQNSVNWDKTHFFMTAFDEAKEELPTRDDLLAYFDSLQHQSILPYQKDVVIPDFLIEDIPSGGDIVSRKYIKEINADDLTLSNGARVIFKKSVENKNNIVLSAFRKGGLYAQDSTDYVSGLFARSIVGLSGAGDFTRDALSFYLADKDASAIFVIEKTRNGISASARQEDAETMFQLLHLKWMYPRVDSTIFIQLRNKEIENFRTKNKTKTDLFHQELALLLQGKSYVSRELTDTIISNELKIDRILPVFNKAFGSAKDYTFVIISDCEQEDLEHYILQYIGSLPSDEAVTEYKYTRPYAITSNVDLIKSVGHSPKATVSLVFQDYNAADNMRMNEMYGEMFKSVVRMKLLKSLREEMGMVYSVGVSVGNTLHPSPMNRITIGFNCDENNVYLLINKTMEILKDMSKNPTLFTEELKDVKINLKKEMELNIQKDTYWSSFIRNSIFNNQTDWEYIASYPSVVELIDEDAIAQYIREVLKKPLVKAILLPEKKEKQVDEQ